jgi:ABC-type glutathione transport system ATPase component
MLLEAEHLSKTFRLRSGLLGRSTKLLAVSDASLTVPASGSVAIVGETGSGKTTVARMIVGLEIPTSGEVRVDGVPLSPRPNLAERRRRARLMQMVFQNPFLSLDSRQAIGAAIGEVVRAHGLGGSKADVEDRVGELLDSVGLDRRLRKSRPRQLSGGQCQRAAIARALAAEPELLVLDEPVSALDVSTQAQVLNLLADLREKLGIGVLMISHDLALVRQISDYVVVMHRGDIVETGPVEEVLTSPREPYTRQLLAAVPERLAAGAPE